MSGSGSLEMSGSRLRTGCCGACCGMSTAREPDMNGRGFITISMHELERVKIIEAVIEERLVPSGPPLGIEVKARCPCSI